MRCLITGAAGFIGCNLYRTLREAGGHIVVGIDNGFHPCRHPIAKEAEYADVRYFADIEPFVKWADVTFHLAAQIHVDRSVRNPQETIDINITGTSNILEAARRYGKQVVFASSSEVYGTAQTDKITESHPLDGHSPYAASKAAGDRLCKAYHETYGLEVAILRNFNTFGPYQGDDSYGSAIAIFTRRALRGEPLLVYGDGLQERDYISIDDAVAGYNLCLSAKAWGQPINVGSGNSIRVIDLAKMIVELAADLTGQHSEIKHVQPRPGEVKRLCADTSLAQSYGFVLAYDFENALEKYVRWYKETQL